MADTGDTDHHHPARGEQTTQQNTPASRSAADGNELTPQPEFDFDGNPLPPIPDHPHGYAEVSRVFIHEDEPEESQIHDSQSLTDAQLERALAKAKEQLEVIEKEMKVRQEIKYAMHHAAPENPSHLAHRDPNSNQFNSPIVPVIEIIPNGDLTKGALSTTAPLGTPVADVPHPPCTNWIGVKHYFLKWRGQHVATLPISGWRDLILAFFAALVGIGVPALLNFNMLNTAHKLQYIFIIASFGASAVLLYGVPMSDFSQPRNVIGGHTLSALIGVAVRHLIFPVGDQPTPYSDEFLDREWLACALAVALSVVVMNITKTTHPPGGATALQACLVSSVVKGTDWSYIGFMGTTACVMTFIALIFNNLPRKRIYPKYWY